jgi:hypothetical protein
MLRALAALPLVVAVGGSAAALPGIPSYAQPYRTWTKLNSKPIPPRAVDPHRSTKNVYVSRLPRNGRYPLGTIVVKEGRNRGFVSLIAVMRKTRARAHNGWVMIEWTRPTRTARFAELARGSICTSCHLRARRTDYVFTKR